MLFEQKDSKLKLLFYIYFLFMLLFYLGYTLLWNHRMNMSEHWQSVNNFREEDMETLTRLANWTEVFELAFVILFISMSIFYFYKYRKDKNNILIVKQYLFVHLFLLIIIVTSSFILARVTPLLIGNLLVPLYMPAIIFVGLLCYMVLGLIKSNRLNSGL
ncbi:hypothetical protein [Alkalibacillus silvisoli]|uniref:Uncharacterized protein n=1 Tax=Alkalibacillus silvisoli TaxID=392823 RepID=A0ABN0ZTC7_9BACI